MTLLMKLLTSIGLLLTISGSLSAAELSIRNESLQLRVDASANSFSLTAIGQSKPIVRAGSLRETGGKARIVAATDKFFGKGQAIEIIHPSGNNTQLQVYPKLPFVLFRSTLKNTGSEISITDRIRPLGFAVDLGVAPGALNVLGTGGLAASAKAPGSYMWVAIANPQTRNGIVAAWLTSYRGSGVLFPELKDGTLRVDAQIDYGKLRVKPGQTENLETFALGYFADARFGLEAWADAVAKVHEIKLPPQPLGYCTWYHARASTDAKLAIQTAFAAKNLKPYGFGFVQIDDGWQDGVKANGPKKNFTQVDPKGPYPTGMKATADNIRAQGFVPGIWFMPFAGTYNDPWFKDHQDWFPKRADGTPYDVFWGGTSLDMTHPGAREYVSGIARRLSKEWGYKYFKMDGLWTGSATEMRYVNDAYKDDFIGNATLFNPDKTNIEAYRDGLKLVREAAGKDVFFLGCNTQQNMRTYGGSFGLVDAMRIGPDNGITWAALIRGPRYGARNYFLHNRVWYNDPDPLYVRTKLALEQARLVSAWVTVSGQLSVSSDDFAELPPERLDLLRRTMPSHNFEARPVDLFEHDMPRIWHAHGSLGGPRRDVIGLFNWETTPAQIEYPLDRIGLAPASEYVAFDLWTNTLLKPFRGMLKTAMAASSSTILSVRPVSQHPQLISTSRHIMQGMVDVTAENWNAKTAELSGSGKVVGGDPYELRIVTGSARGNWKSAGVQISAADRAAGVSASLKEEPELLRVTIQSPANRDVNWKIRFGAKP